MTRSKSQAAQRKAIVARIDEIAPEWKDISLQIHDYPELGLKEEQASAWLAAGLTRSGFVVKRNVAKMPTAFVAPTASAASRLSSVPHGMSKRPS